MFTLADCGICVLAGGQSRRMGRDKSRVRLGGPTMLGYLRKSMEAEGLKLKIVRRDAVPGCGPLGGIYTALGTSREPALIFLACDMPFVPATLLRRLPRLSTSGRRAVFTWNGKEWGFPCLIPGTALPTVAQQLGAGRWSIQELAEALKAVRCQVSPTQQRGWLFNVNTPVELEKARELARRATNKTGLT